MSTLPATSPGNSPARAARWFYRGVWAWLVRWMRVPEHPPTLPAAPGQLHLSFQPSAAYLRYRKLGFWIGIGIIALLVVGASVGLVATEEVVAIAIMPVLWAIFLALSAFGYLALHVRYDTMWYVLTDRSLRIRRGIWIIHEVTITFENVQNVRVMQGPLQRMFGIANVQVETAGGGVPVPGQQGGQTGMGHQGLIEGVSNATEIRDLILSKLKKSRTAGLGDEIRSMPAMSMGSGSRVSGAHLAMLREIRDLIAQNA